MQTNCPMKNTRILLGIFAMLFFASVANAQTNTTPPVSIDVLKTRASLLKETTNLNKLKIKLTELNTQMPKLEDDVARANERSAKSAVASKDAANKMNANTADKKLAKKASKAAKDSYSDARRAQKLTDNLLSTQQKINKLNADIEKLKVKIDKMDQQLKFSENVN